MPIEGAAYSNCDSLKPHSPSRTASQSKYNPPGPGSYKIDVIDPNTTSKFNRSNVSPFSASGMKRFVPEISRAPGPGQYALDSSVGLQGSSQRPSAARTAFGQHPRGSMQGHKGPGPGDYRPESHRPVRGRTAPSFSFGGPMAKNMRFQGGQYAEMKYPRSPGPGNYMLPKVMGNPNNSSPKLGTARRFMTDNLAPGATRSVSIASLPQKGQSGAAAAARPSTATGAGESGASAEEKSYYAHEHDRPGPGTYHNIPRSIGTQVDSSKPSAGTSKFGTSARPSVDMLERSPGPGEYKGSNRGTFGDQPASHQRTSPQFKFGTAPRRELVNAVG